MPATEPPGTSVTGHRTDEEAAAKLNFTPLGLTVPVAGLLHMEIDVRHAGSVARIRQKIWKRSGQPKGYPPNLLMCRPLRMIVHRLYDGAEVQRDGYVPGNGQRIH